MPWTAFKRAWLGLVLALALAAPAWALSPYSHLEMARRAWPQVAARIGAGDDAREVFLAGALGPDAGYYPGGRGEVSDLAHLVDPWAFCRQLTAQARGPRELAFAWGWVGHAVLDVLSHGQLINPAVGGPFSGHKLAHKRLEWGLACQLLERPEAAWLWGAKVDWRPGLGLWARAVAAQYGPTPEAAALDRSMAGQMDTVHMLPTVFWLTGQLKRPDHPWGNALGWLGGVTVRPAYAAWLRWTDGDMDRLAVLTTRRPTPAQWALWSRVMAQAQARLLAIMDGGAAWPTDNLDVDQARQRRDAAESRQALRWLRDGGQ